MTQADTRRRLILRRQALVVLRAVRGAGYEGWMSDEALWRTLRTESEDLALAEVRECLAYLSGKDYIERRAAGPLTLIPGEPSARITPAGEDLLDGVVPPDPGVAP